MMFRQNYTKYRYVLWHGIRVCETILISIDVNRTVDHFWEQCFRCLTNVLPCFFRLGRDLQTQENTWCCKLCSDWVGPSAAQEPNIQQFLFKVGWHHQRKRSNTFWIRMISPVGWHVQVPEFPDLLGPEDKVSTTLAVWERYTQYHLQDLSFSHFGKDWT